MTRPWPVSYFCAMASRSAAVSIRGVRPGDVGRLQAIQLAAGDAFRDVGMSSVAESPPLPAESLSGYRQAGGPGSPWTTTTSRSGSSSPM